MISEREVRKYCKEDFSKIENYDKAKADTTTKWHCHHRDEVKILPSGIEVRRSIEELKDNGRYYNCPANELIFLTPAEHNKLHKKGITLSKEQRNKLSKSMKGRTFSEEHHKNLSESLKGNTNAKGNTNVRGKVRSVFGNKFKEHYGITHYENPNLYRIERQWYLTHNKVCRWEEK